MLFLSNNKTGSLLLTVNKKSINNHCAYNTRKSEENSYKTTELGKRSVLSTGSRHFSKVVIKRGGLDTVKRFGRKRLYNKDTTCQRFTRINSKS